LPAIHDLKPAALQALVTPQLLRIPTGLLESECLGTRKAAFTGAIAQRIGRFEVAMASPFFWTK